MARSRNIKPGFFVNSILGEMSPIHRLLFIGLWTIADREGRVFDRPKQIAASVLPYDHFNPSRTLQDLHDVGFILRYEIQGVKYIQIVNFLKHQNPHIKEQKSTIPAPDMHRTEHHTSPINARLIPDSLNLIPDSSSSKTSSVVLTTLPGTDTDALPVEIPTQGNGEDKPKVTKAGYWAIELRKLNVRTTSMHPTMLQLIEDGYELPSIVEAVSVARQRKPFPEMLAIGYLDPIVRNPPKGSVKSWYASESATIAKGKELGLEPRPGEEMEQYRDRLRTNGA